MKTILYYFSSTGNSLSIARDLASKITGDCEIQNIAQVLSSNPETVKPKADQVGVVFPVYMFTAPLIIRRFFEKLEFNHYLFAVATMGGMSGYTFKHINKIIEHKKIKLSAGFLVQMPGNYTPLYGAKSLETQQKFFNKAVEKISKIAEAVNANQQLKPEVNGFCLLNLLFSAIVSKSILKIPTFDKNFTLESSCNGCGTCAKVCPVKNIKMENKKPVWQHKCEHCMGCLQWCPQEAIQYGKTKGRKRYHNPKTQIKDFIF